MTPKCTGGVSKCASEHLRNMSFYLCMAWAISICIRLRRDLTEAVMALQCLLLILALSSCFCKEASMLMESFVGFLKKIQ